VLLDEVHLKIIIIPRGMGCLGLSAYFFIAVKFKMLDVEGREIRFLIGWEIRSGHNKECRQR
jgi:hypothetical protein